MKYVIKEQQPLLDALSHLAPEASKSTLRSWLKQGRVIVDGKTVKIGTTAVRKGQTISLKSKKAPSVIEILYSDPDIAVIDKPAGILSVATHYESKKTAHGFLKEIHKAKKVYPVHRLDKETSGVMVFALSERAREGMKQQFEKHSIIRQYYAIVEGSLKPRSGTWKSRLFEDKNYTVISTNDPKKGKEAVTHFRVIKKTKKTTHIRLNLETGKKNQIRVHSADAGHPVVGDKKYGPSKMPFRRLCLHAEYLEFIHPVTGEKMTFNSSLPKEFDYA